MIAKAIREHCLTPAARVHRHSQARRLLGFSMRVPVLSEGTIAPQTTV